MKKSIILLMLLLAIGSFFATNIKTIAIMNFQAKGVDKNSASVVSDIFRDSLFGTKKFTVVDRDSMNEILQEQNLQQSLGCTSTECAVKIGRVLGVQGIIVGTLGKLGDVYILSTRLVNVENAKIIWTKSVKIYNFNRIDEGVDVLVNDLVNTLSNPGQVSQNTPNQPVNKPQTTTNVPIKKVVQPKPVVTKKINYNYPPLGLILELGISPIYNYYLSHVYTPTNEEYTEGMKEGFSVFKIDFYFSVLSLGLQIKSFTVKKGTEYNYTVNGTEYTGTMTDDVSTNYLDFSLGYKMKSGKAGFTIFSLIYRTYSGDTFSSDTYYSGPGIDVLFRLGGHDNYVKTNKKISPLMEFNFSGAYMFFHTPEESVEKPSFSSSLGANMGFGIMYKPIGMYLIVNYDLNLFYLVFSDTNILMLDHGVVIKLGIDFNLQSILG